MKRSLSLSHTPPYPPCGTEVPTGRGTGAAQTPLATVIPIGDFQSAKPLTLLHRHTREVELICRVHGRHGYRVDLDRVQNAADLLGWIEHLCEKTWLKPRHIRELIRHVEQQNGVTIGRNA